MHGNEPDIQYHTVISIQFQYGLYTVAVDSTAKEQDQNAMRDNTEKLELHMLHIYYLESFIKPVYNALRLFQSHGSEFCLYINMIFCDLTNDIVW